MSVSEREFDLLDGRWYAGQPYADWAWMREHAPAYWDAANQVWAITRYDDVLRIEKDPATFSSFRAPRPHGHHRLPNQSHIRAAVDCQPGRGGGP